MKKRLFTYAVIAHKEVVDTAKTAGGTAITSWESAVVIKPTEILAKDDKEVLFKVTRLIPAEHAENPENVEIIVRPF